MFLIIIYKLLKVKANNKRMPLFHSCYKIYQRKYKNNSTLTKSVKL